MNDKGHTTFRVLKATVEWTVALHMDVLSNHHGGTHRLGAL